MLTAHLKRQDDETTPKTTPISVLRNERSREFVSGSRMIVLRSRVACRVVDLVSS